MAKKLADYHVHTGELCIGEKKPHSSGTWEDYWKAGKKLNIIPGNSNHAPHYFGHANGKNLYPFERNGIVRGDKYWAFCLKKNLDFRNKHRGAKIGLEIDFFEDVDPDILIRAVNTGYLCFKKSPDKNLLNRLKKRHFDYLILSNHFVFGRPFDYDKNEFRLIKKEAGGNLKKIIKKYWQNVLQLTFLGRKIIKETKIKKIIIGHLELIKIIKLFEEKDVNIHAGFEKLINEILKNIKKFGLCLEYNIAGIRKGVGPYLSPKIQKKAKKMRLKITFGSDSHSPSNYQPQNFALDKINKFR